MRGTLVILRAYGDQPLVRRVWDANERVVYCTTDEYFDKLMGGQDAPRPIGFPREDVFEYDPSVADHLKDVYEAGEMDWAKLKPWKPGGS